MPTPLTAQGEAGARCRAALDAWLEADQAWSAELVRVWKGRAGDARYDRRGVSTPELARLHVEFDRCRLAWCEAIDALRALNNLGPITQAAQPSSLRLVS